MEGDLLGGLLYDPNGNMIGNKLGNKRQYEYIYDYKNRLVEVTKLVYKETEDTTPNKIKMFSFSYDTLGRRTQATRGNEHTTYYIYAGQDALSETRYNKKGKLKQQQENIFSNTTDDILASYVTIHSTKKIEEEYINKKGKTKTKKVKVPVIETTLYYYEKNHLGSIVAISDTTGSIVEEYDYDVFGKAYKKNSTGEYKKLGKTLFGNKRLYTGRELERGLGLYYNRARFYSPRLGRFISRDPIGISDDVNLYAYVGNSPVMYVDRFGREKQFINARNNFVNAWDKYINLKENIYGILPGSFDLDFVGLSEEQQIKQFSKLHKLREKAKLLHYGRNALQPIKSLPQNAGEAVKAQWKKSKSYASVYHQEGIPDGKENQKWTSENGRYEVVFRYDTGVIDTSIENMGTLNFYPGEFGTVTKHREYDVRPWKEFGSGYGDMHSMR